jgi:UDP-glucose 4-epimerase
MTMRLDLSDANILIVGGAGFIGSHLVDRLLEGDHKSIVILDNMFLGTFENVASACALGAILCQADAEDYTALMHVIESHAIDVVFNLATKALNHSFTDPMDAFCVNVNIIGNLLELLRSGHYQTLCHYSSSEVYGTAVYTPMDEAHPVNPTTTYAGGKAAADIMLKTYVSMFDVDAFILRPFNNYGPRQNHKPPLAAVIPLTAARIKQGLAPEIHGSGSQSRDFIFVHDTVDATIRLYPLIRRGQEVNITSEQTMTIARTVELICEITGYDGEIITRPPRGADVQCHDASSALLKSMIDFAPTRFMDGLRQTVDWYWENLS